MDTTQIIRGAAEVLTITRLAVNDCYKRVDTNYSGDAVLRFGVVTDVMENGQDAAVVVLEFRPADFGSGVEVQRQVLNGQGWAIFPAQPEEVAEHMEAVLAAAQKAEDAAHDAWEKAAAKVAQVRQVAARLAASALTTPATAPALPAPTYSQEDLDRAVSDALEAAAAEVPADDDAEG
jgi:hypothetical protein